MVLFILVMVHHLEFQILLVQRVFDDDKAEKHFDWLDGQLGYLDCEVDVMEGFEERDKHVNIDREGNESRED